MENTETIEMMEKLNLIYSEFIRQITKIRDESGYYYLKNQDNERLLINTGNIQIVDIIDEKFIDDCLYITFKFTDNVYFYNCEMYIEPRMDDNYIKILNRDRVMRE